MIVKMRLWRHPDPIGLFSWLPGRLLGVLTRRPKNAKGNRFAALDDKSTIPVERRPQIRQTIEEVENPGEASSKRPIHLDQFKNNH